MDCTMNMGIYKITNIINNKFYIGSSVNIKKRRRDHLRELKNNIHSNERMQHSFNKYGNDNFTFEVIQIVRNKEELREIEQRWMDETNVCHRDVGFNIARLSTGGGSYGKENPNFGNKGIKNPLSKQIAQINPDTLEVIKVWGASIDIQRELGIHAGNLCKLSILVEEENIWKKAHGFHWCYEKDIHKLKTKIDFVDPQKRKVIQMDSNTKEVIAVYECISDAAIVLGVGPENISRCCKNKSKTSGGFAWKYGDEEYKFEGKNIVSLKGKSNPRARTIVQKSLDGYIIGFFDTVKEAAESNAISAAGIYTCLSRGRTQSGGYGWMYLEDYETTNEEGQLSLCL